MNWSKSTRIRIPAAMFAVCIATLLAAASAQAAFPGQNGRIAFTAGTNIGNISIYSMNPDGTGLRKLTDSVGKPDAPEWSPDSQQIVFTKSTVVPGVGDFAPFDLYRMNADGSGVTSVTTGAGTAIYRPFWLSNTRVGFLSIRGMNTTNPVRTIDAIDANGGARQVLFTLSSDVYPFLAFSPDGGTIAALGAGLCPPNCTLPTLPLVLLNRDGSKRAVIQLAVSVGEKIDWSPDGRRLALVRGAGQGSDVYTVNADGSGLTHLTSGWGPTWSPDGRQIAFTRYEPLPRLYVINADGSGERLLLGGRWRVFDPSWGSAPLLPSLPPLRIAGSKSQRFGRNGTLRATASCTLDCKIRMQATVSVNQASKLYKSKKIKLELSANKDKAIRLKFPAKAVRAFRGVLKRGKRLRASITAAGKDLVGTPIATTRRIRLRK